MIPELERKKEEKMRNTSTHNHSTKQKTQYKLNRSYQPLSKMDSQIISHGVMVRAARAVIVFGGEMYIPATSAYLGE